MQKATRFVMLLIYLLPIALLIKGCTPRVSTTAPTDRIHPIISYFDGEHKLRKFVSDDSRPNVTTHSEGWWWFIVVGGGGKKDVAVGKQRLEDCNIVFYWQLQDGTYAISELPLRNIRIRIDSTATTPTIRFVTQATNQEYWEDGYSQEITSSYMERREASDLIRRFVSYAVLSVREEDWPIKVQLPLN